MFLDNPRGFRDPERVAERRQLLETSPGAHPLRAYRDQLIARRVAKTGESVYVPDFDPADAASATQILFVLEAPGSMTNASTGLPGSGFISVDNNDATAENAWNGRAAAGLHTGCLAWNIVPWYLGPASTKPNAEELRDGALELAKIVPILPDLRVVVLHGTYAQRGWLSYTAKALDRPLSVAGTWHPSRQGLTSSLRKQEFAATMEWAARKAARDSAHS